MGAHLGRKPLMHYTGICEVCGLRYAVSPPFRSVVIPGDPKSGKPDRRVETCPGCCCRWQRNREFTFQDRGKHRKKIPELVALRVQGVGVSELARKFGMDRALVYRHLRKYNLHRLGPHAIQTVKRTDRRSRVAGFRA